MEKMLVYPLGSTPACQYAAGFLHKAGAELIDHPSPEVTHLLLDAPSFQADGCLRGGGSLRPHLQMLPPAVTVLGGNLDHPDLTEYKKIDLLKDADYLAENAALTADSTLRVAAPLLRVAFAQCPVLIVGWGRIGKCLGALLKSMGAQVTIAARKPADRAMIRALGYEAVDIGDIRKAPPSFRLLINTVPQPVLTGEDLNGWKHCVKIDLASVPGIEDRDVIWARGLPGLHVPESSGRLMAKTILRLSGRV